MIFGKRKTIGVFISKAYAFFDTALFRMLRQECRRLDYDVMVFTTVGYRTGENYYDVQENSMFDFAPVENLDGIIAVPDSYEQDGFRERLYEMLSNRARCPVVAVRHQGEQIDCVFTDEDTAIRPLIRHLIRDHGLKRIAFLAGYPGHPDGEKRLQAYRAEMAENGLPVPEEAVCYGTMWINCGEAACAHFFSDPARYPEAVVCANDYSAAGLISSLERRGIRVPEDVIVTGFDNIPNLSIDVPALTTVEPDFNEMVRRAILLLDQRMRGEGPQGPASIPIPGKMVLGESCGCGRRPADHYRQAMRRYMTNLSRMSNRVVGMTYLSIELSACDDLNALHSVLIKKKSDIPNVRDFYLCLFDNGGSGPDRAYAKTITDSACLVHVMRDQQDHGMPMIRFDRRQVLPALAERTDEPQLFYVKLLHQRDYTYGYSVFQFYGDEVPTEFYQQWNVLLSEALQNMHKRDELQKLYEERRLSSITDVMTGLLNRRGLEEKIGPQWQRLCAQRETVAFIYFDMDRLKQINDTYGHQAGDFAIRLVARAIQLSTPADAIVCHMSGDEFVAFLPQASAWAANRFIAAFEEQLRILNEKERRSFTVTASCGYALTPLNDFTTIEQCIQASDEAMYCQKEARRAQRELPGD